MEYEQAVQAIVMIDAAISSLEDTGDADVDDIRAELNEVRNRINAMRLDLLGGKLSVADII